VSGATAAFGLNYRNQVNSWTSQDNGVTWKRVDFAAGFVSPPVLHARVLRGGVAIARE